MNETITNNINEKLMNSVFLRIKKSSHTLSLLSDVSKSFLKCLLKVNEYVLSIKTKKHKCKKQIMNQLNVNWDWLWNTFVNKINLKKEINAQLWNQNTIVADKNNYWKFMITHKDQNAIMIEFEQKKIVESNSNE